MRFFARVTSSLLRMLPAALGLATLSACAKSATLDDLLSGKVPVAAAELAVVRSVLREAGTDPLKARLFVSRKEFDGAFTSNGAVVETGHVTAFRIIGGQLSGLAPLCSLPELRVLAVPSNRIEDLGSIGACSNLETLDLSGNRLRTIERVSAVKTLKTLRLDRNRIESAGGVGGLPLLRELSLADNQLTSADGIAHLPELSTLALSGNKLTSLGTLEDLPKLARLMVANNSLTVSPPRDRFPLLRDLDTKNNPIPTEAGTPVATADVDAAPVVVRCSPDAAVDLPAETIGSMASTSGGCSTGISSTTCEGAAGTLRGINLMKRKVRGSSAALSLHVGGGKARAYLACGTRFIACTATPHHPCVVEGTLSRRSSTSVTMVEGAFWLEAVGASADGVSYTLTAK